ncbi:MAG TPA: YceD family protein [Candidatus Binatia bacterium]|jgi:uncharacterized protein|nr:YceD family protein [Candidatus Binatia bacterium]
MPLLVNLRHLDPDNIHLKGELPVEELDIDIRDEVIRLGEPLRYDLEVQKVEDGLLVQGSLHVRLECQCVRCLKPFKFHLELEKWAALLPLTGEEAVTATNDCVDLTPHLREDILLEFPQHPLCDPDCSGLPKASFGKSTSLSSTGPLASGSPAWEKLNKLKL